MHADVYIIKWYKLCILMLEFGISSEFLTVSGLSKKLGMLLHHRHQTWTFLLLQNGCSSNIEWMLGLDINRTWLFLHHSVKGGSSDYTQWSLLCAPIFDIFP